MAWKLGVPVSRLKEETSATEFLRWVEFYTRSQKEKKQEFYYLAAIRFEVYKFQMSFVKDAVLDKSIEDFLLDFASPGDAPVLVSEEAKAEAARRADLEFEACLFASLGVMTDENGRVRYTPPGVRVSDAGQKPEPAVPSTPCPIPPDVKIVQVFPAPVIRSPTRTYKAPKD